MKVNLCQFSVGHKSINQAIKKLKNTIERHALKYEVILLPELWISGLSKEKIFQFALEKEKILEQLKLISQKYCVNIVTTLPIFSTTNKDKLVNKLMFISHKDDRLINYEKIHLFPLTHENKYFIPGSTLSLLNFGMVKIGFAICYDIRFPELFRQYALNGADIIFVTSCFPKPRLIHWQTLLRSRAIENQIFIVAVNAVGEDQIDGENIFYFGHSMVINPMGDILLELDENETSKSLKINLTETQKSREKINYSQDLRSNYHNIKIFEY